MASTFLICYLLCTSRSAQCLRFAQAILLIQVENGGLGAISASDLASGMKQLKKVEGAAKSGAPLTANPTPKAPAGGMAGVISVADLQSASSRLKKVGPPDGGGSVKGALKFVSRSIDAPVVLHPL